MASTAAPSLPSQCCHARRALQQAMQVWRMQAFLQYPTVLQQLAKLPGIGQDSSMANASQQVLTRTYTFAQHPPTAIALIDNANSLAMALNDVADSLAFAHVSPAQWNMEHSRSSTVKLRADCACMEAHLPQLCKPTASKRHASSEIGCEKSLQGDTCT